MGGLGNAFPHCTTFVLWGGVSPITPDFAGKNGVFCALIRNGAQRMIGYSQRSGLFARNYFAIEYSYSAQKGQFVAVNSGIFALGLREPLDRL
jgi:hypothetical protein